MGYLFQRRNTYKTCTHVPYASKQKNVGTDDYATHFKCVTNPHDAFQ